MKQPCSDELIYNKYQFLSMVRFRASCLVLIVLANCLMGCFSPEEENKLISSDNLTISPEILIGAQFQTVDITTSSPMSVHIPYLVKDEESGYVTNGTTLDFYGAGTVSLELLAPSNINTTHFSHRANLSNHHTPTSSTLWQGKTTRHTQ